MQVGSAEGTVAEFACATNAESMSVRTLTEVAYFKPRLSRRGSAMRVSAQCPKASVRIPETRQT